jgi:hypothetical protein
VHRLFIGQILQRNWCVERCSTYVPLFEPCGYRLGPNHLERHWDVHAAGFEANKAVPLSLVLGEDLSFPAQAVRSHCHGGVTESRSQAPEKRVVCQVRRTPACAAPVDLGRFQL